jgi:hypothetical protein
MALRCGTATSPPPRGSSTPPDRSAPPGRHLGIAACRLALAGNPSARTVEGDLPEDGMTKTAGRG